MRKQSVWVRPHFLPLFAILCDCENKLFETDRVLTTIHHSQEKYSFAKSIASKRSFLSSSFNAAYTPSANQSVISSFSSTLYSSTNLGTWSRLTHRAPQLHLAVHGFVRPQQFSQMSLLQPLLLPHRLNLWAKHAVNSFILHIFVSLLVINWLNNLDLSRACPVLVLYLLAHPIEVVSSILP